MLLSPADWQALWLSLKLAALVTALLAVIATPIAWWLARTRSRLRAPIAAVVAMPLVLPPTVLGFYLLLAFAPAGPIGALTAALGVQALPFTFAGLVLASLVYSLPFMVQPLQSGFAAIGQRPLEMAATLGASPLDAFVSVVLPLSKPAYLSAAMLTFAHTLGEFGVVLMIGGNLPGATRVASVALYDHVQAFDQVAAGRLAAMLLLLSFVLLLLAQRGQRSLFGLRR
ncbi:MAG: molybdate ABC transporter permease subunit [Lysobacterales bacterium]